MKLQTFSRQSLLAALLLILFFINSCKKDALIKSDLMPPPTSPSSKVATTAVDETTNITQKEIFGWIGNLGGDLPFTMQWDKMQKGVFYGKYAVKVPISDDAAMFFTKKEGAINVFIYRWHNDNPGSNEFTGRIMVFNLQKFLEYDLTYKEGKVVHHRVLSFNNNTPVVATHSAGPSALKTQGIFGEILNFIQGTFCRIFGGDWVTTYDMSGYNDHYCSASQIVNVVDNDGGTYDGGYNNEEPVTFIYVDPNIGVTDTNNSQNYGGGTAWVYTAPNAYNSDDGCHITEQTEAIPTKKTNAGSPPPPPQNNINGCGKWTDFSANLYSMGLNDQLSEGVEAEYNPNYWEYANLTIPPQTLPTFQTFFNAYPSHNDPNYNSPQKMYYSIGGELITFYNNNRSNTTDVNTCAVRISKALNYSGVIIPNLPGKTYRGADNVYYFVVAADLKSWMIKTFGKPTGTNIITGEQGGDKGQNFVSLMKNKVGIYFMTPNDQSKATGFAATGHADFLNYLGCDGNCYLRPKGGVKEVLIWPLN